MAIQHGVRDLIRHLVGVALGYGFGSEFKIFALHSKLLGIEGIVQDRRHYLTSENILSTKTERVEKEDDDVTTLPGYPRARWG